MIDEKVCRRQYFYECSLIKDEIFQKNNYIHFEQKVYKNREINAFKTINDERL